MIRDQEERSAKQKDLSLSFESRRLKEENNVMSLNMVIFDRKEGNNFLSVLF